MKLAELDPHWLTRGGRRFGLIFRCPTDHAWWQVVIVEPAPIFRGADSQFEAIKRSGAATDGKWQPANAAAPWRIDNIEQATFDDVTVSPSIDGSAGGLWHGFITNGEIVGGL
ncbi:MAG TPA: hypothetical protein VIL42_10765 [Sphingomicrobium sp.]|jgi:hypothetical protein